MFTGRGFDMGNLPIIGTVLGTIAALTIVAGAVYLLHDRLDHGRRPRVFVATFIAVALICFAKQLLFETDAAGASLLSSFATSATAALTSLGMAGAALLFACSYLHASGLLPVTVFAAYVVYVAAVMVAELYRKQAHPIHNWAYFLLGQVMVAVPFASLCFILFVPCYRPLVLLAVFVTIWVNDTGAYLTGMAFGRHKMFERVSPKKSWEGFVGGAVLALVAGYVFHLFIPELSLWQWLVFAEIVVACGTLGDLNESLLKRTLHVKDSGHAIPGHGGLLDRFDSMLLAAPMVLIFLLVISV